MYSQNLDDSNWTNSLYPSPQSGMENTSFFTKDISNLSSALLKEDDPGEGGERNKCTCASWGRRGFLCVNVSMGCFIICFSPSSSVAASLFPEFLGAFHKNSSSAVFELLDDYQALCQDKVGCWDFWLFRDNGLIAQSHVVMLIMLIKSDIDQYFMFVCGKTKKNAN